MISTVSIIDEAELGHYSIHTLPPNVSQMHIFTNVCIYAIFVIIS